MKPKPSKTYLLLTMLLFSTEALIAIFLDSGFIRHTFGDFLVVILIYCFFKSFFGLNAIKLAIAVYLFAFFIEFLQLANILQLSSLQNNHLAKLILGSTFQVSDLVAYTLGIVVILYIDLKFITNESPLRAFDN